MAGKMVCTRCRLRREAVQEAFDLDDCGVSPEQSYRQRRCGQRPQSAYHPNRRAKTLRLLVGYESCPESSGIENIVCAGTHVPDRECWDESEMVSRAELDEVLAYRCEHMVADVAQSTEQFADGGTLAELAAILGCTKERVRQIEADALASALVKGRRVLGDFVLDPNRKIDHNAYRGCNREQPLKLDPMERGRRILAALAEDDMTIEQLAEEVEETDRGIRNLLERLCLKGLVSQHGVVVQNGHMVKLWHLVDQPRVA